MERLGEVPLRPWGRERGAGSLTSFRKRPLEFLSAEGATIAEKESARLGVGFFEQEKARLLDGGGLADAIASLAITTLTLPETAIAWTAENVVGLDHETAQIVGEIGGMIGTGESG